MSRIRVVACADGGHAQMEAWALCASRYADHGLCWSSPPPGTLTLAAMDGDRVVATAGLVQEPHRLPALDDFGDEVLHQVRTLCLRRPAEIIRQASEDSMAGLRGAVEIEARIHGALLSGVHDALFEVMHPSRIHRYEYRWGARIVGTERCVGHVGGALAVLLIIQREEC